MVSKKAKLVKRRKALAKKTKKKGRKFRREYRELTRQIEGEKQKSIQKLEKAQAEGKAVQTKEVTPTFTSKARTEEKPEPEAIKEEIKKPPTKIHTADLRTDKKPSKVEIKVLPAEKQKEYIPLKILKDEKGNIIGIEDTITGETKRAEEGQQFTEESITKLEQERKEIVKKEASLKQAGIGYEAATTKLYQEFFTSKGKVKQKGLGAKILTGVGYKGLAEKKVEEYKEREKQLQEEYFKTTTSIYTGDRKFKPSVIDKDLFKVDTVKFYDEQKIIDLSKRADTEKITKKTVGLFDEEGSFTKQLKESGYYYLATRPTSVTVGEEFIAEESLRVKGKKVEQKISEFYAKESFKAGARIVSIGVGGKYIGKGLGAVVSKYPITKPVAKGVGKLSSVLFTGYVGVKGYNIYSDVKKKQYSAAVFTGVELGSTLVGVSLIPSVRTSFKERYTKIKQRVESKITTAKFHAKLRKEGLTFKEWQQLQVEKQLTKYKDKLDFSEIYKKVPPKTVDKYPTRQVIDIRVDKSGKPVVTVKKVNWAEVLKMGKKGALMLKPPKQTFQEVITKYQYKARVGRKPYLTTSQKFKLRTLGKTKLETLTTEDITVLPILFDKEKTRIKLSEGITYSQISAVQQLETTAIKTKIEPISKFKPKLAEVQKPAQEFKPTQKLAQAQAQKQAQKQEQKIALEFETPTPTETPLKLKPPKQLPPVLPTPITPPIPYVPYLPRLPRFERKPTRRTRTTLLQPKVYQPSLLGIARGQIATIRSNLSGFEVRGIPKPTEEQLRRKKIRFGATTLTPVKHGISMKFKISKPKKSKKKEISVGKHLLKKIKTARAM